MARLPLDAQLRDGRVVGRVQDVTSGSELVVRAIEELLAFLTAGRLPEAGEEPAP